MVKKCSVTIKSRAGTLAERLAHQTHNPMMDGSNPGRSNKTFIYQMEFFQKTTIPRQV